jgi:DNA-binding MarR family transcriptional regulator
MNKTVELVNEWAVFEERHPAGSVEDFCRYYLIQKREERNNNQLFSGVTVPPRPDLALAKLMGRIMGFYSIYAEEAAKSLGLKRQWEFYFLNYIAQFGNPKKTEVIYQHVCELSTGLSILESLKTNGFIEEKEDPDDKRSRRVNVTPAGTELLFRCYQKFGQVGEIVFGEVSPEDLQLCIQLIQSVDDKHAGIWQQYKGKPFDETYAVFNGKWKMENEKEG